MQEIVALNTAQAGMAFREDNAEPPTVHAYDPAVAVRWDEFVRREPRASFYHLSGWMRVMQRTYGYSCCSVYAAREGRITGVLPLLSTKNWIAGHRLVSTPFAIYGGIASKDDESYLGLLGHAKETARKKNVEYLELRNSAGHIEPDFHADTKYVTFTGELSPDPQANFKRLPRDTRYMIRKAEKQGLQVRHGIDLLWEFYELYALSLRRHGTPIFPKTLFTNLVEEFGAHIDLLMLYAGENAVTGVFTFLFGDTVLPHYAGASKEAPRLAANNLMYWELMRWAAENGYRRFDFGRSKRGTGAFAFKSQWSMQVHPLPYQVFLVKKTTLPDYSPMNPRFERATRIWSRLPLWLTKRVGPHVVRWFP